MTAWENMQKANAEAAIQKLVVSFVSTFPGLDFSPLENLIAVSWLLGGLICSHTCDSSDKT